MDKKRKKIIFSIIILIAITILMVVGSTFAYFVATTSSEENAVSLGAAEFKIALIDDTSLLKSQIIPTEEKYVDMAINRLDENGKFIAPYQKDDKYITEDTVCIDDNKNEICSVYTFTIQNPMTDMELPLYLSIVQSVNTFTNLKFKVVEIVHTEEEGYKVNEVVKATHLVDDRYEIDKETGGYKKDKDGNKIPKINISEITTSPIPLEGLNAILPKAIDKDTPSEKTYSIIIWVEEIHENQTEQDSGKIFAAGVIASAGGEGNGITGVFTAAGVEEE